MKVYNDNVKTFKVEKIKEINKLRKQYYKLTNDRGRTTCLNNGLQHFDRNQTIIRKCKKT